MARNDNEDGALAARVRSGEFHPMTKLGEEIERLRLEAASARGGFKSAFWHVSLRRLMLPRCARA